MLGGTGVASVQGIEGGHELLKRRVRGEAPNASAVCAWIPFTTLMTRIICRTTAQPLSSVREAASIASGEVTWTEHALCVVCSVAYAHLARPKPRGRRKGK